VSLVFEGRSTKSHETKEPISASCIFLESSYQDGIKLPKKAGGRKEMISRQGYLGISQKNVAARRLAVPIERGPDNRAFIS
jgi:hypothetical protein